MHRILKNIASSINKYGTKFCTVCGYFVTLMKALKLRGDLTPHIRFAIWRDSFSKEFLIQCWCYILQTIIWKYVNRHYCYMKLCLKWVNIEAATSDINSNSRLLFYLESIFYLISPFANAAWNKCISTKRHQHVVCIHKRFILSASKGSSSRFNFNYLNISGEYLRFRLSSECQLMIKESWFPFSFKCKNNCQ